MSIYPIYLPLTAFCLDLLCKDPQWMPHPVQLIGQLLTRLEKFSRKQELVSLKSAGAISLAIALSCTSALVIILISIPVLKTVFILYLGYAGLALGSLVQAGRKLLLLVEDGQLKQAREGLSMLVSRDTHALNQEQILQTLAETLSENFNDAFVAPFSYLLLSGPWGLWLYKTISTCDSMWGYKTKKWRELGWAGARADDLLAFIPARISAGLLIILGQPCSKWQATWQKVKRQARLMESPNAGWPMAACAIILQGQMGGEFEYFGEKKEKPVLGPIGGKWTPQKVKNLLRMIYRAGICWAITGQVLALLILV